MTETEFLALVDQLLDSLESQADDWSAEADLDVEASRNGHVLTLVFDDSSHVVINAQTPLREIWVASRGGGFHYRYDGRAWHDTRGGPALPEALSQICSAAADRPLTVRL